MLRIGLLASTLGTECLNDCTNKDNNHKSVIQILRLPKNCHDNGGKRCGKMQNSVRQITQIAHDKTLGANTFRFDR